MAMIFFSIFKMNIKESDYQTQSRYLKVKSKTVLIVPQRSIRIKNGSTESTFCIGTCTFIPKNALKT